MEYKGAPGMNIRRRHRGSIAVRFPANRFPNRIAPEWGVGVYSQKSIRSRWRRLKTIMIKPFYSFHLGLGNGDLFPVRLRRAFRKREPE